MNSTLTLAGEKQAPQATAPPSTRVSPTTLVTCTLLAAFVAMRLWRMTDISLDGDEIFSLLLARRSWHDLLSGAIQDAIHPPLFYFLLKIWVWIGGESLFWLRMFPLVVSVLCLFPVFALCKRLGISAGARNLALAISAVHPYSVFYGQHTRMYGLLILGAMVSAWCYQRYIDHPSRRNLVWLTIANICMVYSHYYGWMIVGLEFAYLLWLRRKARAFMASIFATALVFAPWAWAAGKILHGRGLEQNLGWLPRPHLGEFVWFFADLTGFAEIAKMATLGATIVLVVLALSYRRGREPEVQWMMWLWIAPAPIAFMVSQWMTHSIWGHRHMVFTLWPFLMVFADSVWRLRWTFRGTIIAAIAVWAVFAISFHKTDNRKFPWDTYTIAVLEQEHSDAAHVPIYAVDPYMHFQLWFYMDCLKTGHLGPFGPHLRGKDLAQLTAAATRLDPVKSTNADLKGTYFWAGYSEPFAGGPTPRDVLQQRGCRLGPDVTASGRFQKAILFPVHCP